MALNLALFGRWALRDKVAQRPRLSMFGVTCRYSLIHRLTELHALPV